jgi:hypothetical protein
MRPSIKQSLSGLLVVGALAFSAVGADAMGGGNANGPDAYIGIIGGHPAYGGGYQSQGEGFQANTALSYQNGHHRPGGYGTYSDGYYHGY